MKTGQFIFDSLRSHLKARHLTYRHIAEKLGVSEQTKAQGNGQIDGQGQATLATTYNLNGQPEQVGTAQGPRRYNWDALGRLTQVRQGDQALARYAYDHRGLRTTKTVSGSGSANTTTHTLYNESRQPLAELNAQGRITRQYIWLADRLLAVMDSDSGLTPASAADTANTAHSQPLAQEVPLTQDLWALVVSWGQVMGSAVTEHPWQLTFIHSNHLGAPELATNAQGLPVWAADYAPFGGATVRTFASAKGSENTGSASRTFTLHIRLPGQVWDEETGLHYNRQRYYAPERGQYLSPDPLGQPDGPNAYLYAAGNPLTFIDPDGLILFAFDGTGNSNDQAALDELGNGISNVWQFRQLYADGNRRYVTGVGTRHRETDPQFGGDIHWSWGNTSTVDMGGNFTGPQRIERMVAYFNAEAELFSENSKLMDVDIVGFSRGAAEARDFANRINANTKNGQYSYTTTVDGKQVQHCQMINFRFMGLWDTVLSTNLSGTSYNMTVIPGFQHVAQAVALNEYRGDTFRRLPNSTGAFPLESIMGTAVPVGQTRIEMGFIGSHADIGGGFQNQENGLPLVTLNWMIEQAKDAGVKINDPIRNQVDSNPVLHDKTDNQYCLNGPGCSEDRAVHGGSGGTQRQMTGTTMTYADTGQFVSYYPPQLNSDGTQTRTPQSDQSTGTVDMTAYLKWLRDNGYELGNLKVQ
ncbi:RHS repeat-associated core domain-containing protein [Limnohabitans sp. Jir72]|uniref:RHS repeat-associated core domain-containing protein n=1 Tax=Limnohabitans sp. Jir72 TaxID=1977909 RepID=UPI001304F0EC|nr:RHS repeat-associated core domain-containing protein [Limnohabitans sp. Jir72]